MSRHALKRAAKPKPRDGTPRTAGGDTPAGGHAPPAARRFVHTAVSFRIAWAATRARELQTIAVCYGPAGCGKTTAALALAGEPRTAYVRITESTSSRRGLRSVLSQVRFADAQWLRGFRGVDRCIVIDDGHRLKGPALEAVQDLHDETGVPILMLCTKDLATKIRRSVAVQDRGAEFRSRVGLMLDLMRGVDGAPGVGRELFSRKEVVAFVEAEFGECVSIHDDAVSMLHALANDVTRGCLFLCRMIVMWAIDMSRWERGVGNGAKVKLTASLLRRAEEHATGEAVVEYATRTLTE